MKPNLFKKSPYYLICIVLFVSCNFFLSNTEYVKNSVLNTDYSMKIGDVLDNYKYFKKTEWKEFTTIQGAEVVEFNGYYNQTNLEVRIQFVMNKDRKEDSEGTTLRLGFVGYKYIDQTNDESSSDQSLINSIYENKEISYFSYLQEQEEQKKSENLVSPSGQLVNSNNMEAITKVEDDNNIPSYFVITSEKAYFYTEPDNSTIRKAYLINGQRFLGQKTVNNFVYGVYSNPAGKETKGWIRMSDVRKEN